MKKTDVLIIGGGPAGLTAGIYTARAGLTSVVVEKAFPGGQAATTNHIANYPGFQDGIGGPELTDRFAAQYTALPGSEICYDGAAAVDLTAKTCTTSSGETIQASAVILCMGAQPRKLGIPGERENIGRGVSYCATCDGMFFRGKTVAVIGGGDTAVEDAYYLKTMSHVILIHRRGTLRAVSRRAEELLTDDSVEKYLGYIPVEIRREGLKLILQLKNTATGEIHPLQVDGVFVAVGTEPDTALVQGQLSLAPGGYIPAGEDTHTEIPGIYAAGDLRAKPLRQVITAASDGAVAASEAVRFLFS